MIITAAIAKGGTGKSTMLRALASVASNRGYDVTIIDCDVGQHMRRWVDMLEKNNTRPAGLNVVTALEADEIVAAAEEHNGDTNLVLIDTEGTTNDALMAGLYSADCVIIPIRYALDDVLSGCQIADNFVPLAQEQRERVLPAMFVVTQHSIIDDKANALAELRQIIQENGTPIARTPLMNRMSYRDLQSGHTLYSFNKPDAKAIAESEALFNNILAEFLAAMERAA
ncbi:ParA family protein [Agrobacterium tumefaciens]|uniref:ParA family protein n=1 Tax=Agrobacterium tumefaciens TaxID=358 RepID=UPI00157494F0|nr:ParA family protein [Agrobacterium tumefaciens]NTE37670.1 ParA family protein [Agrobacterium tumefaciens]NTE53182.1 ParA family protein [Agrobacterium tumefaciens]